MRKEVLVTLGNLPSAETAWESLRGNRELLAGMVAQYPVVFTFGEHQLVFRSMAEIDDFISELGTKVAHAKAFAAGAPAADRRYRRNT